MRDVESGRAFLRVVVGAATFLSLLSTRTAWGETAEDPLAGLDAEVAGGLGEIATQSPWNYRGQVGLSVRIFPAVRPELANEVVTGRGQLELGYRMGAFSTSAKPRLRFDAFDNSLKRIDLVEGYVEWAQQGWDGRIGKFVEAWGLVDTFNPLDVLSRRDAAPNPMSPVALGDWGGRGRLHFLGDESSTESSLALYWFPFWQETPQPEGLNRFSFAAIDSSALLGEARAVEGFNGHMLAASFQHTLYNDYVGADLQYIFGRGPSRTPVFALSRAAYGELVLTPEYYGWWFSGVGLRAVPTSEALNGLTVKLEATYKRPYRIQEGETETPRPFVQVAAGLEYSFSSVLLNGDNLTTLVEVLADSGSNSDQAKQLRIFDHDIVLVTRWEAWDAASTIVESIVFYDPANGDSRVQAHLQRTAAMRGADLSVRVGYNYLYFHNSDDNPYGELPPNSYWFWDISLSF